MTLLLIVLGGVVAVGLGLLLWDCFGHPDW